MILIFPKNIVARMRQEFLKANMNLRNLSLVLKESTIKKIGIFFEWIIIIKYIRLIYKLVSSDNYKLIF
jgi:hypothetical protein